MANALPRWGPLDQGLRAPVATVAAERGCTQPVREPDAMGFRAPARRWLAMSAVTILLLIGAAVCLGLCAYGITTAVRRARDRRAQGAHPLTRH